MPEEEERPRRRPWFHLITDQVLERSGPSKKIPKGADVYAGQLNQQPGDNLTKDLYDQAERQTKR